MSPEAISARIKAYAARPEGISRQDTSSKFSMLDRTIARRLLDQYELDGTLIGVLHKDQKRAGKPKTRLFATQALADAWMAAALPPKPRAARKASKKPGKVLEKLKAGAVIAPHWRDKPAPSASAPVFTGKTKYTVAPAFVDRRWQPAPGERIEGAGFSALRMGQYIAPASSAAARAVA